jgi:hypothetical protein
MVRFLSLAMVLVLASACSAQYTGGVSAMIRSDGSVVGNGIQFQQGNTIVTVYPNGNRSYTNAPILPTPPRPRPAPSYAPVQGVKPYQPYPRMDQLGR